MRLTALALISPLVGAINSLKTTDNAASCVQADLSHRLSFQNKLAGICEDMCKEVGAYPQCAQCPGFVAPDSTPGVMTWDELLEHMDNLVEWGQGEIKGWKSQASALQKSSHVAFLAKVSESEKSCLEADLKLRGQLQNKMAGICEDMCKEVGAYPQCAQCPGFVAPDSTPGVMTWDELLDHMDTLVGWGQGEIKGWKSQAASALLQSKKPVVALAAQKSAVKKSVSKARSTAGATKSSFVARIRNLRAANPLFSEENCSKMFSTKLKLGGTVPPADFVVGCVEVCDAVKKMKDFWKTGDMATYSCSQGSAYGCVYDGTPPVALSGIGC
jgi:hypothetical protein